MIKLLFFVILFYSSALLAAPSVAIDYYIVLTNPDNVGIMEIMINSMASFFGNTGSDPQRYYSFIILVITIGTVWATIQLMMASISGSAQQGFKHYFIYLVMLFAVAIIIYGPKSTVMIQDKAGTTHGVATEVPTFYAFTLSLFTTIRFELSDISSRAFNVPDPSDNWASSGGSGGLGYNGAQSNLSKIAMNATFNKQKTDPTLSSKYEAYLRDCIILPGKAKGDGSLDKLKVEKDIFGQITPTVTGFGTELVTYQNKTGFCSDFWDNNSSVVFGVGFVPLKNSIAAFQNDINRSSRLGRLGSSLAYIGALLDGGAGGTTIANAAAVKSAVTQAVLSNEYRTVFAKMGVAGEVSAAGAAQTQADLQTAGIASGLFAVEQIPRAGFVLFALMVGAVPFLFAFALFPGAGGILINFLKTLLWISLWEPMASILGVFQDYHFAEKLKENGYTAATTIIEMTPDNIIDLSSEAGALAGIAGTMFIAIQGLSWMLLTGSGQMVGNLLSATGQSFQRHSSADAQIDAGSDLKEAAMMSKNLGKQVSTREMYSFQATARAAAASAELSSKMQVHGSGAFGEESQSSTAHVDAVDKTTNTQSKANAYQKMYGEGGSDTSGAITHRQTTEFGNLQKTKTIAAVHNNDMTSIGKVVDANTSLTEKKNVSSANKLIRMSDAQIDTVVDATTEDNNAALQKTEKVMEHTKKTSEESVDLITATETTESAARTVGDASKQNTTGSTSDYLTDHENVSKRTGETLSAESDAIEALTPKQLKNIAINEAEKSISAKNISTEQTNSAISEQRQIAMTARTQKEEAQEDLKSVNAQIEELSSYNRMTTDPSGNETTKINALAEKLKRGDISKQEYASQMQQLSKDSYNQGLIDTANDIQEYFDNNEEFAKNNPEKAKTFDAQADLSSKLKYDIKPKLQKAEDELGITELKNKKQALEQTITTQGQIEDDAIKRADAQETKMLGAAESLKESKEKGVGATGDNDSSFEQGIFNEQQKVQVMKSLADAGVSTEEAAKTLGTIEAMAIAGEVLNTEMSSDMMFEAFSKSEGGMNTLKSILPKETFEHFQQGGDAISRQDKNNMMAAAKGLKKLSNDTIIDGGTLQTSTDSHGNARQSNWSTQSTYKAGSSVDLKFGDTIAAVGMGPTGSPTEIALRKIASNALGVASSKVARVTRDAIDAPLKVAKKLAGEGKKKIGTITPRIGTVTPK